MSLTVIFFYSAVNKDRGVLVTTATIQMLIFNL